MYLFDKPEPWKTTVVKEDKRNRQIMLRVAQLHALLQKIDLENIKTFDIELALFLTEVRNDGYNEGVAHMNKIIDRLETIK